MLQAVTCLWAPNSHSYPFSRMYDESWVEKLYRGFRRNLTGDFNFVVFTDSPREFSEPIMQLPLLALKPDYSAMCEPYALNEPMILVGLDTIITGNIDHLAEYCLTKDKMALPRDPNRPEMACNGVALVPAGHEDIANNSTGENDMKWVRRFPHVYIDDLFPGQVVSYKGHVKKHGLGDARIVYFHGHEKPHELDEDWIREHWQ